MKIFDASKIIKYTLLALVWMATPAQAQLGMQELADSLFAYTGFSRLWSPPVRIKNMRISGNTVILKTNATLHDYRWTPQNIADIKRKVSLWTLGHEKGKVTIYSSNADIETLVTDCSRSKKSDLSNTKSDLTDRQIVLYPSHGLFHQLVRDEWIWQRATMWTTVEDLYSQEYVRLIRQMLENAGATVISPRPGLEQQQLGVSGMPQWTEGARYWLQSQGADSTLWNLYEDNEYNDDMKCRGMWVNAQQTPVDLCVALHTDGLDSGNDTTIVGTLVIYTAKDDDGHTVLRDGRDREKVNRNLADWLQTTITDDLRRVAPEWTRRQLKEANYCESRVPVVPSLILELLSHKNMADMKYGLDPQFRFTAARAVYKGILRYLNGPAAIVQPIPVQDLGIQITDTESGIIHAELRWTPSLDSIEPSAAPSYYMVYIQENDGEWDVQQVEKDTRLPLMLTPGVQYNYYVVAGNDGGLGFPSPTISAYVNEAPTTDSTPFTALIVDGFTEVYGPDWFADSTYAGIVPESYACEDRFSCAYIGQQMDYRRSNQWINDDNCGWGMCYRDHAGQLTVGNTHDYAVQHGRALRQMQISYVSCTAGMLPQMRGQEMPEWDYVFIDYICGRNKQPLSDEVRNLLELHLTQAGKLLLSTDHFSAIDPQWAKRFLHASYYAAHATHSGRVRSLDRKRHQLVMTPNEHQLFTCHPEGLKPAKDAVKIATYEDMHCPAAVGYQAPTSDDQAPVSATLVYGFPLETVMDFDKIYHQAVEWLIWAEN